MKRFRYVVVCSNGQSLDLAREESFNPYEGLLSSKTPTYDLPDLLGKGWYPVRETPMGGNGSNHAGGGYSFSLVLLEKEKADVEPTVVKLVKD